MNVFIQYKWENVMSVVQQYVFTRPSYMLSNHIRNISSYTPQFMTVH